MILPELLAPAGSTAALYAAVSAGADAVYLGMGAFNARRNAENFTEENIEQVCDYAHLRGVKVYVAMNTIVLPEEMDAALTCAAHAFNAGADAFIVQDIGLMLALRRKIPDARLHASTQMNIHSASGIEAVHELGVSRVTLARELSLGEIEYLAACASNLGMQVETFVHGALCVSYSGQCFMSSMIGGRSANRGLCAQACRLNYELVQVDGRHLDMPGDYLLSPKDLCGIDLLPQLIEAGVASLKIEGRMKSPEYVFAVASVYREVLNRLAATDYAEVSSPVISSEEQRNKLASVFSRGFTTAYLEGKRGNEIMSYQRPNNRGQFIGRVKWVRDGSVGIACEQPLMPGDVIEFWTKRGRSAVTIDKNSSCEQTFAIVKLGEKDKVYENDRVFRVRSVDAAFSGNVNEPRIPVVGQVKMRLGEPLEATFRIAKPEEISAADKAEAIDKNIAQRLGALLSNTAMQGFAAGEIIEPARSKEVDQEDVAVHIDRMGSSPFKLLDLEVFLDAGVGIGFSALHHVRAEALDCLSENILAVYRCRQPVFISEGTNKKEGAKTKTKTRVTAKEKTVALATNAGDFVLAGNVDAKAQPEIVALCTNAECAHAAKRAGAAHIYVPALNYRRTGAELSGCAIYEATQTPYPKHCTLVMPVVNHDSVGLSREARLDMHVWESVTAETKVVVQDIGGVYRAAQLGAHFEIGAHLPIVNQQALEAIAAFNTQLIWLSPELNLGQISALASKTNLPLGLKIFGAQELMTTEHCVLASQGACNEDCPNCAHRTKMHVLKDRKGYEFPVVTDAMGRTHIYNSVKLDLTPELAQLRAAGIDRFMVDTTLLNAEQTAQALGYCIHALRALQASVDDAQQKRSANSTSGHIHRGVL